MLAGGVDVRRRSVDNHDAARSGGRDVHVVETHTGTADDLEVGRGGEDFLIDRGGGTDEQRVSLRNGGEELGTVGTVDPADLHLLSQCSHGGLSELVSDEDYRLRHYFPSFPLREMSVGCIRYAEL